MTHLFRGAVLGACFIIAASTGFAAGTEDNTPPAQTNTTTTCKDGEIWDAKRETCTPPKESGLSDDVLFDAAREFAHVGLYDHALGALDAMRDQSTPRVLTYRGYAHRKAGRIEKGLTFYDAALAIDPDFLLARSYLGQALAERGDTDGALAQLEEIRQRGGRDGWPYIALRQSLRGVARY